VTNAIIIITALFATTSTYAVIRYSTGKSVEDIKTYHQQADDTGDAEPPEEVKKGTNARDEP
jgi:hypothetical protein